MRRQPFVFHLAGRANVEAIGQVFNLFNTVIINDRNRNVIYRSPTDMTIVNSQYLADGSLDDEIPGVGRSDEVGAMAATLYVLVRGVIAMANGKDASGEVQQGYMQKRVLFQGIAIVVVSDALRPGTGSGFEAREVDSGGHHG